MSVLLAPMLRYDSALVREGNDSRSILRDAADAVLVEQAKQEDFAAFEELVRRYRNDVYRLAFHYVRNREEAWDVSQEVFIKVYRSLRWFRGDSQFKTWALRITANQCKDFLKKRKIQTISFDERLAPDAPAPTGVPSHSLEAAELGEAIQAALGGLSHKHRTAFLLREFEGLSYEEMAQVMNCSLGTVMSRLHHARKRLQQALVHMGVMEGRLP